MTEQINSNYVIRSSESTQKNSQSSNPLMLVWLYLAEAANISVVAAQTQNKILAANANSQVELAQNAAAQGIMQITYNMEHTVQKVSEQVPDGFFNGAQAYTTKYSYKEVTTPVSQQDFEEINDSNDKAQAMQTFFSNLVGSQRQNGQVETAEYNGAVSSLTQTQQISSSLLSLLLTLTNHIMYKL